MREKTIRSCMSGVIEKLTVVKMHEFGEGEELTREIYDDMYGLGSASGTSQGSSARM